MARKELNGKGGRGRDQNKGQIEAGGTDNKVAKSRNSEKSTMGREKKASREEKGSVRESENKRARDGVCRCGNYCHLWRKCQKICEGPF